MKNVNEGYIQFSEDGDDLPSSIAPRNMEILRATMKIAGILQAGIGMPFMIVFFVYMEEYPHTVSLFWLLCNFCFLMNGLFSAFTWSSKNKLNLISTLILAFITCIASLTSLLWKRMEAKCSVDCQDSQSLVRWFAFILPSIILILCSAQIIIGSVMLMSHDIPQEMASRRHKDDSPSTSNSNSNQDQSVQLGNIARRQSSHSTSSSLSY